VRLTDSKKARLERLLMLRTISGQQAKAESINELIYPTQYGGDGMKNAIPGGFQTRSLGDTLNLTPQIGTDGRTISVTLIPESSFFAGFKGSASEKWMHQPVMGTARLTTSVVVKDGEPFLLGTFTPPFNNGIAAQLKDHRIWLEFLTVHVLPGGK
jgi:type II secretory pathway component GspD/PulD (secretin)